MLVNGDQDAGYHEVRFDVSDLASGVYFYRISIVPDARRDGQARSFVETCKMAIVK
jgi:hypothetical protein